MAASRLSVTETIADVIARRPVLRPILKAFEPLLEARASLPAAVKPLLRETGLCLPEMRTERAAEGLPLLSDVSLQGIGKAVRVTGETMLPLLAEQDAVKPYTEKLRVFFLGSKEGNASETASLDALAESVLRGDDLTLERTAVGIGVPPEVLLFTLGFMLGPVLRALVETCTQGAKAPWDAEGVWRQGYCPVCGSFPSIAYLDRPVFEEKNAFLAGGGGKKHLHCSLCGTDWVFRRGACPSCGEEGNGVMEILRESEEARGERVDWCTRCKVYCPGVDLRERDTTPNLDALALGLVHLDMVAAKKKLHPLNPSFWNTF